jgi:hypothetical protein
VLVANFSCAGESQRKGVVAGRCFRGLKCVEECLGVGSSVLVKGEGDLRAELQACLRGKNGCLELNRAVK